MRQVVDGSPSTWSPDRPRRSPASGRWPLAERFGLDPDQVVAACLHGAREGLLELHWDLLCPVCRISAQVTDTLREIADHAHCQACHLDFKLDFANSIELIFRVHPEIREAELGTYCIGGPRTRRTWSPRCAWRRVSASSSSSLCRKALIGFAARSSPGRPISAWRRPRPRGDGISTSPRAPRPSGRRLCDRSADSDPAQPG